MARSFNGTSDDVAADAAASFSETQPYFVAMWLNGPAQAASPVEREFFSEGRSSTGNPFILLRNDTTASGSRTVIVVRNDAGGTSQINSLRGSINALDGTWHHYVYTQSVVSTTTSFFSYVDGVLDKTGTYTNGATTIDEMTIGCARRNTIGNFFNGKVAEVAKGARLLAAHEALSLANGLPASHLAPDHYWPLWGKDSPEPDIGTAAHVTGTLTGTTAVNGARTGIELLALQGNY